MVKVTGKPNPSGSPAWRATTGIIRKALDLHALHAALLGEAV